MKKRICTLIMVFALSFSNIFVPSVLAEENEINEVIEQDENQNSVEEVLPESENDISIENNEENSTILEENLESELEEGEIPKDEMPKEDLEIKKGFILDENGIKYYDSKGEAVSGEMKIDEFVYCFDEEGYLKLGFQENSLGKSFYIDVEPYLCVNKFQKMEDGIRYFNEKGLMLSGCKKIDSQWYYFDENGLMYNQGWRVEREKRYYYNEDGTLALGAKKIGKNWYYFKNNGDMQKGWRSGEGTKYYYNSNGTLVRGKKKIGSNWYYFESNGKMHVGWRNEGEKRYYYNDNGTLALGVKKIGGYWYYFKNNGDMYRGWRYEGKNTFYYDASGRLQIGEKTINGQKYYFNKNGTLAEDSKMCLKAQQYSSKTKWMILVDTKKNRVGIFSGSKGKWEQEKYWKCTSGAKATPTVKGQFTVGIKGKVFGKGYSCWYYTQFYGDYLFHSILYNPGSMTSVQDGRLGINASHGCVRLSLNNAKWMYNNIPRGTKVVVY